MKDWKRDRFQTLSVFSGATFAADGELILKKSRNEAIICEYHDGFLIVQSFTAKVREQLFRTVGLDEGRTVADHLVVDEGRVTAVKSLVIVKIAAETSSDGVDPEF